MSIEGNMKKRVRFLEGVNFDFEGAHIALTSNGAASCKDEPYLLKSLANDNKESTPLDKTLSKAVDTNTPSSSTEVAGGEDDKVSKQEEDQMSEELKKELADTKRLLAEVNAEKSLVPYAFEEELNKELINAFAEMNEDTSAAITKAFDSLVQAKETAVEKAKTAKVEEDKSELAKALEKEEGHAVVEEDVEKSFKDRVAEARQNKETK